MCLLLEHQNPLKTSEIMGYFDRIDDPVTVSLHILYTANQMSLISLPSGDVPCASEAMACGLLIFKMANNKVDLGQIRSK